MEGSIKSKEITLEKECKKKIYIKECEILLDMKKFSCEKLWITKKSRMNAEVRMKKLDKQANLLINIYTFYTLVGSIGTLFWENKFMSFFTIAVSVGLFGYTNYVNSQNYTEKAFKYRDSYLQLAKLEDEVKFLKRCYEQNDCEKLFKGFEEVKKEYNHIMELYENHDECDYKLITERNNLKSKEYKFLQKCIKWIWVERKEIIEKITFMILALLPILIFLRKIG